MSFLCVVLSSLIWCAVLSRVAGAVPAVWYVLFLALFFVGGRSVLRLQVIPVWPKEGSACVCDVALFADEELRDDLLCPRRCLLSEADWPSTPQVSKVHASDPEWYALVKAGFARNMLQPVDDSEVFTDHNGVPVLAGAMGVDKVKEIDGVSHRFLRFIAISTPINAYLRKLRGDSASLPQAALLNMMILENDEIAWVDSEDLESCFNLFYVPPVWRGFFAVSKRVPKSAFGGPADEWTYAGLRSVSIGWINSVDIIQNFIRRFVFRTVGVSPDLEVSRLQPPPKKDAAVVCMDGFDLMTRFSTHEKCREKVIAFLATFGATKCPIMDRFVSECDRLQLPLNAGKAILQSFSATVLGGELDGIIGCLGKGGHSSM